MRFACILLFVPLALQAVDWPPPDATSFLEKHCYDCHDEATTIGGLDLTLLQTDLTDRGIHSKWVSIHDKLQQGEMPPADKKQPSPVSKGTFLTTLSNTLVESEKTHIQKYGRTVQRRLNRHEYENAIRDLLHAPWLQVKTQLPEDRESHLFNKSGKSLDISHVQMARYLQVAEDALRKVIATSQEPPAKLNKRFYAREQKSFSGRVYYNPFNRSPERATFPLIGHDADTAVLDKKAPMTVGPSQPEIRAKEAMGVVASSYEPLEIRFSSFHAPVSGKYKLRFNAYTFWAAPESEKRWWRPSRHHTSIGRTHEPVSLYSRSPPRQLRKLTTFDVHPEPSVQEVEVYLLKGETIQPDAVRLFRSRPPGWHNPRAERDGQPGVAFRWMEVEGPILETWPPIGHQLLFGDLPVRDGQILSSHPKADSRRLLKTFLAQAYHRPATQGEIRPLLALIDQSLSEGLPFQDAMVAAYTAALCSPGFVTLKEDPGKLGHHALAARLSFFLTNSKPDQELRQLSDGGRLHCPDTLRGQTDRLLNHPSSQRFVHAFLDYWLDLRNIQATSPHEKLYPDYYLDDYLVESAQGETRAFFTELLENDHPVGHLIQPGFAILNKRLADHYGLPGIQGAQLRKVSLSKYTDSPRGGLLTQASVLKVTANGTQTSPVTRGTWINERILGTPPPPPPPSVPAIVADTRGATTIREQLRQHRADPSCNTCHEKIDPVGFALENFDILGGWRDKYRTIEGKSPPPKGYGHNGQPFTFHNDLDVEAHGQLPDGRKFRDIRELQTLLLANQRPLAKNLLHQYVTYATGTPPLFSDRPHIKKCLDDAKSSGYGIRTLLHTVIQSPMFRKK